MPDSTEPRPTEVSIDARRLALGIFLFFVAIEVTLLMLDYHVASGGWQAFDEIRDLFGITREDSLASWLGSVQTLLAGLTLGFIFAVTFSRGRFASTAPGWLILAMFFVYMAVDDGAQLHERLASTLATINETRSTAAPASVPSQLFAVFPSYYWQLVFMPFFAVLGIFMLIFLWRELKEPLLRIVLLLALASLSLAVGLDFLEGLDQAHPWNVFNNLSERFALDDISREHFGRKAFYALRHFSKAIEEFLEMFAISLLWYTFIRHSARVAPEIRIRLL